MGVPFQVGHYVTIFFNYLREPQAIKKRIFTAFPNATPIQHSTFVLQHSKFKQRILKFKNNKNE
jgi:hypothetical protein